MHSICDGEPSHSGIVYHGLLGPHATRTVEGDLGMRHTARSVVALAFGRRALKSLDGETAEKDADHDATAAH